MISPLSILSILTLAQASLKVLCFIKSLQAYLLLLSYCKLYVIFSYHDFNKYIMATSYEQPTKHVLLLPINGILPNAYF